MQAENIPRKKKSWRTKWVRQKSFISHAGPVIAGSHQL